MIQHRGTLDLRLHLLDRPIVDVHDRPCGVVDDVEFELDADGNMEVTGLLTGRALLDRLLGAIPRPGRLDRVPADAIESIDVTVGLNVGQEQLDLAWPERWCSEHIIAHIPGNRRRG